jgi:serine/threonine protein kinase
MTAEAGSEFGPYFLEERLPGAAGMGTVFRARELLGGRVYALKVIRRELSDRPAYRARFRREADILRALEHPNIVRIEAADEAEGIPYIVTEFAPAGDLGALLGGELLIETVLSILCQSAAGLEAAHAKGIVHRDVKPGNLLVVYEGDQLTIKVTDFGIAWGRDFATSYTPYGKAVGTPGYISPECQRGEDADQTADIYSLACCLKAMLGRAGNAGPIVAVLRKAMAPLPGDRQQSAMELYEDAAEVLDGYDPVVISSARPEFDPSDTSFDTPTDSTPVREDAGNPAVIRRALDRLGLAGAIEGARLARGRSDPMLVTGILTASAPRRLGPHLNRLAGDLVERLDVERVRLVLMPKDYPLADAVKSYLAVVFAEDVPAEDVAAIDARQIDGLLEIDLPPRVDRLCDEDVLVPLVAHLGVRTVRVNRRERAVSR